MIPMPFSLSKPYFWRLRRIYLLISLCFFLKSEVVLFPEPLQSDQSSQSKVQGASKLVGRTSERYAPRKVYEVLSWLDYCDAWDQYLYQLDGSIKYRLSLGNTIESFLASMHTLSLSAVLGTRKLDCPSKDKIEYGESSGPDLSHHDAEFEARRNN